MGGRKEKGGRVYQNGQTECLSFLNKVCVYVCVYYMLVIRDHICMYMFIPY